MPRYAKSSVTLVLMKHKMRADGTCPIAIRVTANRKSRYTTTGIRVEPSEWNDNRKEVRAGHDLADAYNSRLRRQLNEAQTVALDRPSAAAVKMALVGGTSMTAYFERHIDGLDAAGQFQEWKKYRVTLKKLRAALSATDILWGDLDAAALKRFERYCRVTKKNAPNTVRKELSRVRRVVKEAVRDGEIEASGDPFLVYELPPKKKVHKRKLSVAEVEKIRDLDVPDGTLDALARDAFVFAFYAGGMRFGDVANLRSEGVRDGRVTYKMLKTGATISVPVPPSALEIAGRYMATVSDRGGFLFPMLQSGDDRDGVHLRLRIGSWNASVNKALKRLAAAAGMVPEGVTFHVSRHSYAHHVWTSSRDLAATSKLLGHSTPSITEAYIKSLDQDAVDAVAMSVW